MHLNETITPFSGGFFFGVLYLPIMGQVKHLVQEYEDAYVNYCAGADNFDELTKLHKKLPSLTPINQLMVLVENNPHLYELHKHF